MSGIGSISMDEFNMNDEIQEYFGGEPVSLMFSQFPLHSTDGVQAA